MTRSPKPRLPIHSLVVFEPFVGVGPRKFFDLFSMKLSTGFELTRKGKDGRVLDWQRDKSCARMQMLPRCYLDHEIEATKRFAEYQEGLASGNGKDTE